MTFNQAEVKYCLSRDSGRQEAGRDAAIMCSVVRWALSAHGASKVIQGHLRYAGPAGQEAGGDGYSNKQRSWPGLLNIVIILRVLTN